MDSNATEPRETALSEEPRSVAWTPAAETRRLYASDWAAFAAWCRAGGHPACPADPATVTAYLGTLALAYSYGALARRVAAIADQHRRRGLAPPATDAALTALLRDARRRGKRRPDPPPPGTLAQLAATCTGDRTGQRDRAILLLLAAGLGRGAIVGLDAEDVHLTARGMELDLRPPAEEPGEGQPLALDRNPNHEICPVRALEDWMRATDTTYGPVFRKVDRWGNVEYNRLSTDAIRRIIERWSKPAKVRGRS
jgi:integrase